MSSLLVFRRMLVEEYRMHTELFGRGRFIGFPLFTAVLVAGGVWLLEATGTNLESIIAGLFVLVFLFGLQVGTIGLIGRDAMRNLLGDITLLVFSGRTLPISRRQLLATFLLKDLVYYIGLFLTPIALGFLPLVTAGEMSFGAVGILWVALSATFAFGAGASLALAGIATRSVGAIVAVIVSLVGVFVAAPELLVTVSPYGLYANPGIESAIASIVGVLTVLIAGPLLFEPPTGGGVRRIENRRFNQLADRGGFFFARSVLEVARSSGSVWKVIFSLGILFAVAALVLERVVAATALEPSAGIAFGTLLGLGSFTTYNWVTQLDDNREYLRYPVSYSAVFAGKFRAFLALSLPTGVGYLALAGIWYPGFELLLGVLVFPLVSIYVFGVTAYLTGLSPNELLFNTPLFALYGAALASVAVPLLVAALAFGEFPVYSTLFSLVLAVATAVVGLLLVQASGKKWERSLRAQ